MPRSSPSSASDLPTPEKPYAAFREFLLREAARWMGRSGRAGPPHQPEADHPHRHHRQRRGFGHRGWVNRLAHRSELSQRQGEATGGLGAPADHVEGGDVRGGDRVLDAGEEKGALDIRGAGAGGPVVAITAPRVVEVGQVRLAAVDGEVRSRAIGEAGDTVGALGLPGLGVLLSERRGTNVDRRITDVLSVLSQAPTEVVAPGRRAWLALMKPPR